MHFVAHRSNAFRLAIVALVIAASSAITVPASASTILLGDTFTGTSTAPNTARWKYWWGTTTIQSGLLHLASPRPSAPSRTYSALLTSRKGWGNYAFYYDQSTGQQLRTGSAPNTWEVPWTMFRFRDLANYYYFILKSNGWELGKKHGSDAQIFLATGTSPTTRVGKTDHIIVSAVGSTIKVWVNGVRVVTFTDPRPILTGAVGLYEEDAHVHFDNIYVRAA